MQFRFVQYNKEKNNNELISYLTDKDFGDNNSPDEIFKLLFEIKKAQEQDYDVFVKINKEGVADSIDNDVYEIKSISLIMPDKYCSKDEKILPHTSVEVEKY